MKQIEVQIMGQSYVLGCPEGADARLLDAVERLDTAMNQIRDAGKVRARDRIAVLAALNLTFDMVDSAKPAPSHPEPTSDANASGADPKLSAVIARLDDALSDESQLF
jgi:cell division protein ZapA